VTISLDRIRGFFNVMRYINLRFAYLLKDSDFENDRQPKMAIWPTCKSRVYITMSWEKVWANGCNTG